MPEEMNKTESNITVQNGQQSDNKSASVIGNEVVFTTQIVDPPNNETKPPSEENKFSIFFKALKDKISLKNINWSKLWKNSLSAFVLLFCFVFFPLFLLYSSLTMAFQSDKDSLRQAKLREMNEALEYLEKYSNNKRYFHFLLSKISENAQSSKDPIAYLGASISNLRKKYPMKLEFVVWDDEGKIVKELSDRAGYSYVLNKLHDVLKQVTALVKLDSETKLSELDAIKKNLNLFRNFFGKIFIPESLKMPLLKGSDAGPFFSDIGIDMNSVWYSIGDKAGFLCFLSNDLLNDYTGLRNITKALNKDRKDMIVGFSIVPRLDFVVTEFPEDYKPDLTMALASFENADDSVFENDRAIVSMAMPQPAVRTFCFFPKIKDDWVVELKRDQWFAALTVILLVVYCVIFFVFIVRKHFFSIRWKLTALFLFANLAPLCIIAFIAQGYIVNKAQSIENSMISDLEKKMRELDTRYYSLQQDYSVRMNEEFDKIVEKVGNNPVTEEDVVTLRGIVKKFECSEYCFVASSGTVLDTYRKSDKDGKKSEFFAAFCKAVLDFANNKNENWGKKGSTDIWNQTLSPEDSEIIRHSVKHFRKINAMPAGEYMNLYYSCLFGNKETYENNYYYMATWDREEFQNIFLQKSFGTLQSSFPEAMFFVSSNDGKHSYGAPQRFVAVEKIQAKHSNASEKVSGNIVINNKEHIFVCIKGSGLTGWALMAVYPKMKIYTELWIIVIQIVAGALLSLLLTMIIGHILSLQFLKPIHNLGEAAVAIGERDFSHRIPITDKDEFGHLSQVFNHAIESLEDLEVARIVQESLFPGNHFEVGDFRIFGRSVVMTTLGGDYYDCFKINDDYQGIIIGDVAGHGVPAGLMMAMAKSGVLTATEEMKLDPAVLTTRLHKNFFAIKNKKLKRMMTFQYFVLRPSDGHFCFTNAGHCFPVIVDSVKKTAEFIEYIATPLGIGPKCRCKNQEFTLEKGQTLLLYTDGIVEANNALGEQFGYDRFRLALIENYDPDPEVFYYNLYNNVYKKWSPKPDDDLTLIIVNR